MGLFRFDRVNYGVLLIVAAFFTINVTGGCMEYGPTSKDNDSDGDNDSDTNNGVENDPCQDNNCHGLATCTPGDDTYECTCPAAFSPDGEGGCVGVCAGRTDPQDWVPDGEKGLIVDVTTDCGFESIPRYFTALAGTAHLWVTTGITSIFDESPTGFRVRIEWHGNLPNQVAGDDGVKYDVDTLLQIAQDTQWHIQWLAMDNVVEPNGFCSGNTLKGNTSWNRYPADESSPSKGIYVDLDTTECGLEQTSHYFASITGENGHEDALGAYGEESTGFTSYIYHDEATADYANNRKWAINWLAVSIEAESSSNVCLGKSTKLMAADERPTETSYREWAYQNPNKWVTYGSVDQDIGDHLAILMYVDTTACQYWSTPLYFTSLSVAGEHDAVLGNVSVYEPAESGFYLYIKYDEPQALSKEIANTNDWQINWMAIEQ